MIETILFAVLMSAPSITDIDLENNALQISERIPASACELRREISQFYHSKNHYWCEPVN